MVDTVPLPHPDVRRDGSEMSPAEDRHSLTVADQIGWV